MFYRLALLILTTRALYCADVSLGVQGGGPLGDFFRPGEVGGLNEGLIVYTSKSVPYTVGPTVEVHRLHSFGLEASFLYQRFHYSYSGFFIGSFSPGVTNVASKTTGNAWSLPILLTYRPVLRLPIFFGAGPVVRNLQGLDQNVEYESTYSLGGPLITKTQRTESGNPADLRKRWYPGVEFAAGWDFKLSKLRISPEIRYTRWTANIADRSSLQPPLQFPSNRIELVLDLCGRLN